MNWQDFAETLSEQLGQTVQIHSATSVSGGDISQAYKLHTSVGNFLLKTNRAEFAQLFSSELHNLHKIADSHSILVPKGIASGLFDNSAWLLLEFVEMASHGDDVQRGRDLALMHQHLNRSAKPFGWDENNFIGLTPQYNHWHKDWVEFYAQQRLTPQLEMAERNSMHPTTLDSGYRLIESLDFWFQDYQPKASLLHGDLWGGNSAFTRDGDAIIFDPASYYGDHETDLAMTELFGGFSQAFYRGYNEVFTIDEGYQSRKPLYNLYHIINHFNLFGGHYQHQAANTIQTLLHQAS